MFRAALAYLALIALLTALAIGVYAVSPGLYGATFFGSTYLLVALSPAVLGIGAAARFQRAATRIAIATTLAIAVHVLFLVMGTNLLWPGALFAPLLSLFLEWRRARRLRTASNHVRPA
ncbi:hypothetical protein QSH18_04340 [Xanthomonas sp. NCPPB 2654]|uniref:hypothetical protein n=1 Tax=unclassified Xanthomonas TaxID=2643310 RepID=UPI0021E09282|nr:MULTISPECIES: hypothetical protein [unclassified Xanthomonas]MDL5364824.1 hypothetical protein [Xanthomonas sp. NCPPB 2654]MDR6674969.1 putative membrane protein [Xanthomonas translucens]UYC18849.1 hypothetical protein NUG20_11600 [Xanthomonas sp. CFBP 8443]